MIVYLMYSMLVGNILTCREYKIRKLHSFFVNCITTPTKNSSTQVGNTEDEAASLSNKFKVPIEKESFSPVRC